MMGSDPAIFVNLRRSIFIVVIDHRLHWELWNNGRISQWSTGAHGQLSIEVDGAETCDLLGVEKLLLEAQFVFNEVAFLHALYDVVKFRCHLLHVHGSFKFEYFFILLVNSHVVAEICISFFFITEFSWLVLVTMIRSLLLHLFGTFWVSWRSIASLVLPQIFKLVMSSTDWRACLFQLVQVSVYRKRVGQTLLLFKQSLLLVVLLIRMLFSPLGSLAKKCFVGDFKALHLDTATFSLVIFS